MSYVPSGTWQSPAPPSASPEASLWWRVGHSWWLLLPILGFNCLAGLGFLFVGLRARRPAWWVAGIVYLGLAWTFFLIVAYTDQDSVASDLGAWLFLASWLASIIHACIINSAWLRWRAGHQPWYAAPTQAPTWPGTAHPGSHLPPPPGVPGYGPTYGPGSPAGIVATPGSYHPSSGPPAASYLHPPTESTLRPPVDPYASPPLDPDLPPPVDPYSGPLPGAESPPRYYG